MLVQKEDRIAMNQRERDVLKVVQSVVDGKRSQAEAARLLKLSSRQIRRLQRKLKKQGDAALVHGLRGKPSNHRCDAAFRAKVLDAYRRRYSDFGPTFACEKLAEEKLVVSPETLRGWLLAERLWQRRRQRDPHRRRRPRRACFGELVQIDTSIHEWLEGRGEQIVLINMIDDATSRVLARFYPADDVPGAFRSLAEVAEEVRSAAGALLGSARHLRGAQKRRARLRGRNPVQPGPGGTGHRVDQGP